MEVLDRARHHVRSRLGLGSREVPPDPRRIIHLRAGDPPIDMFHPEVRKELHEKVDMHGIPHPIEDPQGLFEAREAIAFNFNRSIKQEDSGKVDPSQVFISPGSGDGAEKAALLLPELTLVTPRVGYPGYNKLARRIRKPYEPYDMADNMPDPEHLLHIANHTGGIKLIFLNSPSNPQGKLTEDYVYDEIEKKLGGRDDVYFVSDEVFSVLEYDGRKHDSLFKRLPKQVIIADGISKRLPHGALRGGWYIVPESLEEQAREAQGDTNNVSSLTQFAIVPILDGRCDKLIDDCRDLMQMNRDYSGQEINGVPGEIKKIPGMSVIRPEGALFDWVDISETGYSSTFVVDWLKLFGVHVTGGEKYGSNDHIRISFAAEPQDLFDGFDRIRHGMEALMHR